MLWVIDGKTLMQDTKLDVKQYSLTKIIKRNLKKNHHTQSDILVKLKEYLNVKIRFFSISKKLMNRFY